MGSRGKSKPAVFPRRINVLVVALMFPIVLYVSPSFLLAQQLGMTDVDPNAVLFDSGAITGVGEQTAVGVTMVGPSAVGSIAANVMCASYVWAEGYRYCVDLTFGFPTPGMCVGPTTCLGLGTVAITGVAIGIGKGIVGKILGGGDSSGSGIPAGAIPLREEQVHLKTRAAVSFFPIARAKAPRIHSERALATHRFSQPQATQYGTPFQAAAPLFQMQEN